MSTVVLRNTKGSALTFTEMDTNFSNLNSDKLEEISLDTTPQLGGNLDVNGNSIVSTTDGNIAITPDGTGSIVLDGLNWPQTDGTDGYVLKTDGVGNLSWVDAAAGGDTTYTTSVVASGSDAIVRLTGSDATTDDVTIAAGTNITITPAGDTITIEATSSGLANVVEDTTPQLGGDLDAQGNVISNPVLKDYAETIHSLGSTDTPTITVSNGNVQSVSITSGLALGAFSDAATGQSVTLLVSGSGTASGTGNHLFAGGNNTLTTYSVVSIFYDGTNYWTSIATEFATV
jgi:hypothetical protein